MKSTVAHDPGQQFVVNAFTHHSVGTSGFIYAHLCSTERVRSTTLLRPLFFYEFSLSRNDRNRGGGYRRKICTVPAPFFVSTRPARENEGFELRAMCMDTAGSPTQPYKILYKILYVSARAGRADTETVWEPYRSCTDTLPLDYDRCVKEKNRKKSGRSSVVLRTLSVLQFLGSRSSAL